MASIFEVSLIFLSLAVLQSATLTQFPCEPSTHDRAVSIARLPAPTACLITAFLARLAGTSVSDAARPAGALIDQLLSDINDLERSRDDYTNGVRSARVPVVPAAEPAGQWDIKRSQLAPASLLTQSTAPGVPSAFGPPPALSLGPSAAAAAGGAGLASPGGGGSGVPGLRPAHQQLAELQDQIAARDRELFERGAQVSCVAVCS